MTSKLRTRLPTIGFACALLPVVLGMLLSSTASAQHVRLWDVASGKQLRVLAAAGPIAVSPDGRRLAAAGGVWDIATGEKRLAIQGLSGPLAFSPDGRRVASAGGKVVLWDVATGAAVREFKGQKGVRSLTFHPGGRSLATGGFDHTTRVWDVATGNERAVLRGHTYWVASVAYSPDGKTLATAGHDKMIRLWDAATFQPTKTLAGHTDWVGAVAFTPDGKLIISAGGDKTIRIWDRKTGALVRVIRARELQVYFLAVSPDGRRLAAASKTAPEVSVWDIASGKEILRLQWGGAAGDGVTSLAFSPDGKTLAVSDANMADD